MRAPVELSVLSTGDTLLSICSLMSLDKAWCSACKQVQNCQASSDADNQERSCDFLAVHLQVLEGGLPKEVIAADEQWQPKTPL